MFKKRDAQGLSIQVIILAIIGLVILVVVLFIFSTESGRTINTLERCEARGGECKPSCASAEREIPFAKCDDTSEDCCVGVG